WLNLSDRLGTSERAAFRNWFSEAQNAGIGLHFKKQPARFDQKGLELGDLQIVFGLNRCVLACALLRDGLGPVEHAPAGGGEHPGDNGTAIDCLHEGSLPL